MSRSKIQKRLLITALLIFAITISVLGGSYIHELINQQILGSFEVKSTITMGILSGGMFSTNDCSYHCYPYNFTAISWTLPNFTDYSSLQTGSPQQYAQMMHEININESFIAMMLPSAIIAVVLVFLGMAYLDDNT